MKVLVVDDDRLVCSSLQTILEADGGITVVGTLNSGAQAVEQYGKLNPDVLLMDIRMDGMTGLEVAEILLKRDPDAKVLFLTTFSDDEYLVRALKIGAKGYLLKQNFESIVPSVRAVYMGQRVFGDEVATKLPNLITGGRNRGLEAFGLNERETKLVTQVAEGLSNREISEKLFLSEGTVRNYISAILDKLELRDRTQLAIFYYKHT
ncbi:MAG: response regulator transcription factor [Oscillospiraceae bacterium]|nr:response regulator transcription factor [Oscillospiraceae bacterium]MCI1991172.1 response regulator transcription factor [Oscillospiraceae bacterium]MCI2035413.1 response regulator transcription factor [Oscillospiraceae bacterium]